MAFVKIYAKASLAIALLIAGLALWALKTGTSGSNMQAMLLLIQTLWLLVSLAALMEFPNHKAPVWVPAVFVVYAALYMIVSILLAFTFPTVHGANWMQSLKHSRAPMHYGEIVFAVLIAGANAYLLRHRATRTFATSGKK